MPNDGGRPSVTPKRCLALRARVELKEVVARRRTRPTRIGSLKAAPPDRAPAPRVNETLEATPSVTPPRVLTRRSVRPPSSLAGPLPQGAGVRPTGKVVSVWAVGARDAWRWFVALQVRDKAPPLVAPKTAAAAALKIPWLSPAPAPRRTRLPPR